MYLENAREIGEIASNTLKSTPVLAVAFLTISSFQFFSGHYFRLWAPFPLSPNTPYGLVDSSGGLSSAKRMNYETLDEQQLQQEENRDRSRV